MSTHEPIPLLLWCLGAFLAGSIPFGLLLVKLAGKGDVRAHGSGNIGATNVSRVGGKGLGIVTLLLDIAKGFLPVFLAKGQGFDPVFVAAVALAATCGHVFTPWLAFKGGKGVATALGAALGFHALMVLPSLGLFIVLVGLTRFVSLGSVCGAGLMPLSLALLPEPAKAVAMEGPGFSVNLNLGGLPFGLGRWPTHEPWVIGLWCAIALLVIAKHHENLRRLVAGTESKLWGGAKTEPSDA